MYNRWFMRSSVKKWGNSASVRLPAAILEAANLKLDDPVDVREECGAIVIVPVRRDRYDLAELVAGITDDNQHEEIDTGPAIGAEIIDYE